MNKAEKISSQKLPPFDLEAEQAILGAVFIENASIYIALNISSSLEQDFYRNTHRQIFNAFLSLIEQNISVDLIVMRDELKRRKQLVKIGGEAYLASLVDAVPSAVNIEYHAKIVHDKAVLRRLIQLNLNTLSRCYADKEAPADILTEVEQTVCDIKEGHVSTGFVHISDLVDNSFSRMEEREEAGEPISGLKTGFADIDNMTLGFNPADLIILAARPSMGKTTMARNIIENISLKRNEPTALFSLEMSKEQQIDQFIYTHARVDRYDLGTGRLTDDDWVRLTFASEMYCKAPIFIDDTPGLTVLDIRARAKQLKRKYDIKLFVVDHLHIMGSTKKTQTRNEDVSEMTRGLKWLAKELHTPVMALCQLNRAVELRADKKPQLSDLRDSGGIEQDADIVMFIYQPWKYDLPGAAANCAEIIFAKQREGKTTGSILMAFFPEITRFECLTKHRDAVEMPNPF